MKYIFNSNIFRLPEKLFYFLLFNKGHSLIPNLIIIPIVVKRLHFVQVQLSINDFL